MASEAGRAAHAARVIEALDDRTPGDSDGQALEAINQPPGYRVSPAQAADAPAPPLLTEKGADTQPAELAALPDPQARADRAALLAVAAINVALLLLIGVTCARSEVPRPPPAPAVSSASAEAA